MYTTVILVTCTLHASRKLYSNSHRC